MGERVASTLENVSAVSLARYSGRGQGEGSARLMIESTDNGNCANPHPNPLPEYRAREKCYNPGTRVTGSQRLGSGICVRRSSSTRYRLQPAVSFSAVEPVCIFSYHPMRKCQTRHGEIGRWWR